ncbi:MAG TPA: DUF4852 domain-containing protein [Methylobacter sp.]|jgi:hypothetical protein
MLMNRNFFFYCVTVAAMVGTVEAATPQRLAYSEKLGVEVFALPDSSGVWCQPTLTLNILLKDNSPLMQPDGLNGFLPKLKKVFDQECLKATTAKVSVIKVVDQSVVGSVLNISKADGWTVGLPASESAAVAQKSDVQTASTAAQVQPQTEPSPAVTSPSLPPKIDEQATTSDSAAPPEVLPQPTTAASVLPRDTGYFSALIQFLRANPSLADDAGVIRLWASYRFAREYEQVANQEFKLQPVIQKAKADLAATLAQADSGRINIIFNSNFDAYDFNKQMFPIAISGNDFRLTKPCCLESPNLPNSFVLKVSGLDAITGLPMDNVAAETFAEKRTQYGRINRTISLAVSVKLDSADFTKNSWGVISALGTLDTAAFLDNKDDTKTIYQLTQSELQKMREAKAAAEAIAAKAEVDRQAEIRKQKAMARRDQDILALSQASSSVKLANAISDEQINYGQHLDNLRSARAKAIIKGQPVTVSMLVQMDESGRNELPTKWPGHLQVTVSESQPELKSSGWYLVRGLLSVPDGDSLPPATLVANAVYACTQPQCADATDATTIVDRKLAAINEGV